MLHPTLLLEAWFSPNQKTKQATKKAKGTDQKMELRKKRLKFLKFLIPVFITNTETLPSQDK